MHLVHQHSCEFYMSSFETIFGWLRPVSDGNNLIRLDWSQFGWHEPDRPNHVSRETKAQLQAFFTRRLIKFTLPLAPHDKSAAGRSWLDTLALIPYGAVITYTEFAALAGKPHAARAAGSSCAKNPIPIIYPCHRIIRSDQTLGNYSAGSDHHSGHPDNLTRKAALLLFETYPATANS